MIFAGFTCSKKSGLEKGQFYVVNNSISGQQIYGFFDSKLNSKFAVETLAGDHLRTGPCSNLKIDSATILNTKTG